MEDKGSKKVYDSNLSWEFKDDQGRLLAAYIPNNNIDDVTLWQHLMAMPYSRVIYISKYGKINRTPRYTWTYGQVDANMPNPAFTNPELQSRTTLRTIPNPEAANDPDIINYRDLDFESQVMPPWLESLSQYCRMMSIMNWGFDQDYNSCIIGRYDDGDDSIALHRDDESFLAHTFCANITLGYARDFQFKTVNPDGSKQTHEIKLAHKSAFFFNALEHGLPKRAAVKPGEIRFSISFRNMRSNIGIGNIFYYCRGLAGAVDNQAKIDYMAKMQQIAQGQ